MTNTFMLAGQRRSRRRSCARSSAASTRCRSAAARSTSPAASSCSRANEAYRIENGRLGAPVKGATLIGNGPDVLTRVARIGNDLALDRGVGTCGKDGQSVPVGVGPADAAHRRPHRRAAPRDERAPRRARPTRRRAGARARRAPAGADAADALLVAADSVEARVRGAEIDFVKQARERMLGIRAFVRGAGGLALGRDLDERSRARRRSTALADETVALARATAPRIPRGPARRRLRHRRARARALRSRGPRRRGRGAHRATRSAPKPRRARVDPRIVNSEGSQVGVRVPRSVTYGNSAGFVGELRERVALARSRAAGAARTARMQRDYWLTARAPPRRARGPRRGRPPRRASARCAASARARRHLRGAGRSSIR